MGDRRQVIFEDSGIYVYVHSDGYRLPQIVQYGIRTAEPRWNDESYCTRIIIHNILNAVTTPAQMTGCGIAGDEMDSNYGEDDIGINVNTQQVYIGDLQWTFKEYIEQNFKEG